MTFPRMDRLFLAMIISGLLLAAVATSLFVATSGGNTVAVVSPPPAPILPAEKSRPVEDNRARN